MTNQVFDAVRTVLAVREYEDQEFADDVIRRIAEAGHLTASASSHGISSSFASGPVCRSWARCSGPVPTSHARPQR